MTNEELEQEVKRRAEEKEIQAKTDELSEEQKYKIEKEAQANAVMNQATKNPTALVKGAISQKAINIVKEDKKFKDKINKAGEDTAQTAIDEVNADNRKTNNTSYYKGREQAIDSMGGGPETSKDKQKYMNWIYTGWWYIIMTLLGVFFIAPLKVLLNWGLALSPEQTKKVKVDGKEIVEKTKKLHWVAGLFAIVFYLAYLGLYVWLGFVLFT